jgi:pSer/pThr/pTyr-binding forkhead associated (FHA) protein
MAVRLIITETGDSSSEYVRCFLQGRIVVGRARSAEICLPDMAISTRHAEIRLDGNDYAVVDSGSLNGTQVNGKELVAHRPRKLENGDTIGLANYRIRFHLGVASGPAESRDESLRQARQMLKIVLGRSGSIQHVQALVVSSGPGKASRYQLPGVGESMIIGRGSEADISLKDRDVSRQHAKVTVERGGIFLRDMGSRNAVIVDDEQVEAVKLEQNLFFTLGRTTMTLEHPAEKSLGAIFDAPEEETSSFAFQSRPSSTPQHPPPKEDPSPAASQKKSDPEDSPEPRDEPPVGPADPLVGPKDDSPRWRTTGQIPRPKVQEGSDMGLIIIGAIIVIAAVVGLVYLFS